MIAELASEYTGIVKFGKINVDQNPKVAAEYQIKGVPTFIFFNSGKIVEQRVGAQSKQQLREILEKPTK